MSVLSEFVGKYISSDKLVNTCPNVKVRETLVDGTMSLTEELAASGHSEGTLSNVMEGLNTFVATIKTSFSDHGRRLSLFGESTTDTSGKLRLSRRQTISADDKSVMQLRQSNVMANDIAASEINSARRRAYSCNNGPHEAQSCGFSKSETRIKTLNMRKRTGSSNLGSLEENFRRMSLKSNGNGGEDACILEDPFPNEIDDKGTDETSEGTLSSVMEGLNNFVATIRTSVSAHGRRLSLFGGSATNTSERPRLNRRQTISADDKSVMQLRQGNVKGNCIASSEFNSVGRRKSYSNNTGPHQAQIGKFGSAEKGTNMKQRTGSNNLGSLEDCVRRPSLKSSYDNRRENTCILEDLSPNEIDDEDTEEAGKGSLSTMMEGLNTFVSTIRTSVSDRGRRLSLFGGSATNTSERPRLSRRQTISADERSVMQLRQGNVKGNCIASSEFNSAERRRSYSYNTGPHQAQSCEFGKLGSAEKATNIRKSTVSNNLGSLDGNFRRPSFKTNFDNRGENTCILEDPSPSENVDEETISLSEDKDELSFFDIVRKNLRSLEMNIVLRYRRYNKRDKLKRRADFYRAKYNTETETKKEKNSDSEKSKGVPRLFSFVRNKFTSSRGTSKRMDADAIRKEVAIKVEKRKQLYKGKSRDEIRAHIRGKHLQESSF